MLRNKKVQFIFIVLLFLCAALAVAQTIPVKVKVTIDCTNDGTCRYKIFNMEVPIDYQITDYAMKAEVQAQCGSLYANLHNWKISWINRNECEVRVSATVLF